jgi:SAM-dependent methyltransferase
MDIPQVTQLIESLKGPIVEVAGPTLQGYEFLDTYRIALPSLPIVTNIEKEFEAWNPLKDTFAAVSVDRVADIRNLPFEDSSLAMIMVSNLVLSSYTDAAHEAAMLEYEQPLNPKENLHLFLYKEAMRTLQPGGVLLQVSPLDEDIDAIEPYGFTTLHYDNAHDETIILQKPIK